MLERFDRWEYSLRIRINLGDLGSLDAHTAHQPFLIKNESVNSFLQRGRGKIFTEARIKDHQAGAGTQLEAGAVIEIAQRVLVHKE